MPRTFLRQPLTYQEHSHRSAYTPSGASRLHTSRASRLSQPRSDHEETETNPGSGSWAYGNDEISLISRNSGTAQSTRRVTGTSWDGFEGDSRPRLSGGSNGGFVKQNAVPTRTAEEKAKAQLAREKAIQEAKEEKLERAESDEDDDSDEHPY